MLDLGNEYRSRILMLTAIKDGTSVMYVFSHCSGISWKNDGKGEPFTTEQTGGVPVESSGVNDLLEKLPRARGIVEAWKVASSNNASGSHGRNDLYRVRGNCRISRMQHIRQWGNISSN